MKTDILVIGGGLAGAAAAYRLAQSGRDVVLIEAEACAHDKVCGEFISFEAVRYLAQLGIDLASMGAAPIDRVRVAGAGRIGESRLPFPAWSLSRRVLDEAVLNRAASAGARLVRGRKVQRLSHDNGQWRADITGLPITSRDCFLATGKHDLRDWKRPPGQQNDLVAFKMHYVLDRMQNLALARSVELFTLPGGYGGLEPIEDGKANLCVLLRRGHLARLGGQWNQLLDTITGSSALMAKRLSGAQPLWPRPLAITSIPYGYVRRHGDGLWRLGDQAAVIPSFAGDGMSIALHSAALATSYYDAGETSERYQQRLAHDVQWQVLRATLVSRMLVSPAGKWLAALAAFVPRSLRITAQITRIPRAALLANSCTANNAGME